MMAWSSSMLFTLKAPSAYLPFRALANSSRVCVNGISSSSSSIDRHRPGQRGIIGTGAPKGRKNYGAGVASRPVREVKTGLFVAADDFAQLEDRQEHTNHHAANDDAEEDDQDG